MLDTSGMGFSNNEEYIEALHQFIQEIMKCSEDQCEYCKHNIPCLAEKCEHYEKGSGYYDEDGEYYPDFKWTCMDFKFGTCKVMEHLPCKECMNYKCGTSKFEWNGKLEVINNG